MKSAKICIKHKNCALSNILELDRPHVDLVRRPKSHGSIGLLEALVAVLLARLGGAVVEELEVGFGVVGDPREPIVVVSASFQHETAVLFRNCPTHEIVGVEPSEPSSPSVLIVDADFGGEDLVLVVPTTESSRDFHALVRALPHFRRQEEQSQGEEERDFHHFSEERESQTEKRERGEREREKKTTAPVSRIMYVYVSLSRWVDADAAAW
jgi:hypothetical protein